MKTTLLRPVTLGLVLLMVATQLYAFSLDFDGDFDVDAADLIKFSNKFAKGEMTEADLEAFAARYARMYSTDRKHLRPAAAAYGEDGGPDQGWVLDGEFDALYICDEYGKKVFVTRYQSLDFTKNWETRGLYEYEIPETLMDPGTTLNSATLYINTAEKPSGWRTLWVHAYPGNGRAELDDLETVNLIGTESATDTYLRMDVTDSIQALIDTADYAGFIIRSGPLMYTSQNYVKFFNGLPHPVYGHISGQLAYLEVAYDIWVMNPPE
jgi:hypothetical protein